MRTNPGLKNIINVRVSLLAVQMYPDTDFSMKKNLINISLLVVTAFVRFPHAK